ncbi:thioredoxin-like protein [Wolfiporia cocos MD-104 SS10]|uniref:Thioredoxin-like protein n=1 Tax=Wolfiporia cocos (strain MD-104) TaxID=742152 RepID=A0A2H3JQV6_WOLCO|nr:thioredoxin-like protein [Wolfiporia cocos MD-104 SS10]
MRLLAWLGIAVMLSPCTVHAALFPSGTQVKIIDEKGFKKAMKQNETSVVAFVAPWCGHCQRMAPEFSKAAEALSPMVPMYAVDCDQQSNKPLCSREGVQGFPTIKLYPRGGKSKPIGFESGQRTANQFFLWASRSIPHEVKRIDKAADVPRWAEENASKPRALLLSTGKDIPILWKAIGNKYKDQISFGILQDKSGKGSVKLGIEHSADKTSKVIVYPSGSSRFVRFDGRLKYRPLNEYFRAVADGSAEFPELDQQDNQSVPTQNSSVVDHTNLAAHSAPSDANSVAFQSGTVDGAQETNRAKDEL